jgi:hypothetical protein
MFPESYQDVRAFALGIAADLAEPTDHVEDLLDVADVLVLYVLTGDRSEDELEFGDPD